MFLGADDYLATEHTLTEVADEVKKIIHRLFLRELIMRNMSRGNIT